MQIVETGPPRRTDEPRAGRYASWADASWNGCKLSASRAETDATWLRTSDANGERLGLGSSGLGLGLGFKGFSSLILAQGVLEFRADNVL